MVLRDGVMRQRVAVRGLRVGVYGRGRAQIRRCSLDARGLVWGAAGSAQSAAHGCALCCDGAHATHTAEAPIQWASPSSSNKNRITISCCTAGGMSAGGGTGGGLQEMGQLAVSAG